MSLTVLVVDDSCVVRQQAAIALRAAGYQVLQASDGAEAILALENHKQVDLVLCDVNMPNVSGLEFLERIRSCPERHGLPVLMVTTSSQQSLVERARQAGAAGWVVKPFKSPGLLSAVNRILHEETSVTRTVGGPIATRLP